MSPKVSVCVPAFNGAAHLRECLDSVLAQTFRDFELLVVDDQSTDDTVAIAQEYARRDPRVRVVRNERNHGLPGNWNRAASLAEADWIKFAFQDDRLAPGCLEALVRAAPQEPALVACLRDFEFEDGTPPAMRAFYEGLPTLKTCFPGETRVSPERFREALLRWPVRNFTGEPTAVMLHRGLLSRLGPFRDGLVMLSDLECWARLGSHVGISYVPEVLATFRVHGASVSGQLNRRKRYRVLLDEAIVLHAYAYDAAFEMLRGQRAGVGFAGAFAQHCVELLELAQRLAREPGGEQVAAEWKAFVAAYPRARAAAGG